MLLLMHCFMYSQCFLVLVLLPFGYVVYDFARVLSCMYLKIAVHVKRIKVYLPTCTDLN